MALHCHNCNTELQERSKFCRMCGTPIRAPLPEVKAEARVPATERVAQPFVSVAQPAGEMEEPNRPVTGRTERAPLAEFAAGQESESSQPLAPATHAIVGLFEQAGFALRFGAFMFDLLLLMILLLVSALLAGNSPVFGKAIQLAGFGAAAAFWAFNLIVLPGRTGQTLGKRLIGIRIISADERRATMKQILLRHLLGYPLSLAAFVLGFLWLLWDRRQQGWHDKLAGTLVVRKRLNW